MNSRVLPSLSALLKLLLVVVILAVLAVAAKALVGGGLSSLNPFHESVTDRTGPSVLRSLTNLSEYRAVSGHQEVVVDLDNGDSVLPDWVRGERVIYVGKGDVDAVVDFSHLDKEHVSTSPDGTSVSIRLPAPTVGRTVLDLKTSYVADHDKGIANRFKGSDLERQAQLRAVQQMTDDAPREGTITQRAKENTTSMLRQFLGALGYTTVTVTYEDDPR